MSWIFYIYRKEDNDIPFSVGIYKLEDGRILTVEKEGVLKSIENDTLQRDELETNKHQSFLYNNSFKSHLPSFR